MMLRTRRCQSSDAAAVPALLSTLLPALLLALLASSCGIGAAGAVAGATGGGDGDDSERVRVDREVSEPFLFQEDFPEPGEFRAAFDAFFEGREGLRSDPGSTLRVACSEPITPQSAEAADVTVWVQRAGELNFIPVEVERTERDTQNDRVLLVRLEDETLLDAKYQVSVAGLRAMDSDIDPLERTTSYFATRDGEWTLDQEVLNIGAIAGGVTLDADRRKFATIEQRTEINRGEMWTQSFMSGEFDDPWSSPSVVLQRAVQAAPPNTTPPEYGPMEKVELQTGGFAFGDGFAFYRISEGDPNEETAMNHYQILRAPIGITLGQTGQIDFGTVPSVAIRKTVPDGVDDAITLTARVDRPGAETPELGGPHFSFNGQFFTSGSFAGAAFWGLSDPADVGLGEPRFDTQRVYGSCAEGTSAGADWDDAVLLSDPNVQHNSWPFVVRDRQGVAYALWYSSAGGAGQSGALFADEIDRYWMSIWTEQDGWLDDPVDITPSDEVGSLPPITDVKFVSFDGQGIARGDLVVFRRKIVPGGTPVSLPSVRSYELASATWSPPTSPPAASGPGLNDVLKLMTAERYLQTQGQFGSGDPNSTDEPILRYGVLRSEIRRPTPRATGLGVDQFVVRWIDDDGMDDFKVVLAKYESTSGTWSDVTVLDESRVSNPSEAGRISIGFRADRHGRASLLWLQSGPGQFDSIAMAQTVNLSRTGASLADFNDPMLPTVALSDSRFTAIFPATSNVHPSGAFAHSWTLRWVNQVFGLYDIGTAMARFR